MGFTVSDIQHARYKLTCIPSIMVPSFQHPRLLFLLPIFGFTNPISPHFTPFLIHNHHGYNFHFQSETCASSLFCRNFLSWNLRSLPGPPMGSFPQHLLPPTMGQEALLALAPLLSPTTRERLSRRGGASQPQAPKRSPIQ